MVEPSGVQLRNVNTFRSCDSLEGLQWRDERMSMFGLGIGSSVLNQEGLFTMGMSLFSVSRNRDIHSFPAVLGFASMAIAKTVTG